nr:hypothetical protein CPGR_00271 [Mycolicibacterium malmesburyense]
MRHPICGYIDVAVGPRASFTHQCNRIRCLGDSRSERRRDGDRRRLPRQNLSVSELVKAVVLGFCEQVHRRESPSWIGRHRNKHPRQPRHQRLYVRGIEDLTVEFDAQTHLASRLGLHSERIVIVFATGQPGDGQIVVARQRGGVDGVIFVDEEGVEKTLVAGDAMDLAECQMLVFEQVVLGAVQLVQQVGGVGCGRDAYPYRHRVDQQSHHRFGADHISGSGGDDSSERDIMLAGQRHQHLRESGL